MIKLQMFMLNRGAFLEIEGVAKPFGQFLFEFFVWIIILVIVVRLIQGKK